jgi:hypothetical protein
MNEPLPAFARNVAAELAASGRRDASELFAGQGI